MKAYLLAVCGAIILSAVVSSVVSDGKMGKFIKGMSRLFVFSILLVPLLSLFTEKKFEFSEKDVGTDGSYLSYCSQVLCERDEEEIRKFLFDEYSLEGEAEVERSEEEGFARKKIVVKIYDPGLSGEEEHINILSRITEILQKNYGCLTEVVWQERE